MLVADLHILAEGIGEAGANDFLDTAAGKALSAACGALGLVIVVIGIVRMVSGIGRGRPGDAFKSLTFALLIGGLLFNLNFTISAVETMSRLIEKVFFSIDEILNKNRA